MVSHIGIEAVSKALEMAGQRNYKIYIDGSKYPVFTCDGKNNKECVKAFENFASNILKNNSNDDNIYHLIIPKATTGKVNNIHSEIYFKLSDSPEEVLEESVNVGMGGFSPGNMFQVLDKMISLVQPFANQRAENQMLKKEIAAIEEEEPEQENNMMGTIINAMLPSLLKTNDKTAIAGVDGDITIDNDLLTQALTVLAKHDKDLDKDLFKLSQIAEKDPKQFDLLIGMLRNM